MNTFPFSVKQKGLSLVELMVSLTISMAMLAGVLQIYLLNKQNYNLNEDLARIQENGRYALHLLSRDVRMAGFYGDTLQRWKITESGVYPLNITGECFSAPFHWSAPVPPTASGFIPPAVMGSNDADFPGNCTPNRVAGTDVLSVHFVSDMATTDAGLKGNRIYVRTSVTQGSLFQCPNGTSGQNCIPSDANPAAGAAGANNYEVIARLYYIRACSVEDNGCSDGIPTLVRRTIAGGQITTDPLANEIASLQLRYGLDLNNDGVVDQYLDANSINGSPNTDGSDWDKIKSAQLWILVRSEGTDATYTAPAPASYVMGDAIYSIPTDLHRYLLFSTSLFLRNS